VRDKILEILPILRRFAFALTGNIHDADDLVQSTIERVLVKGAPHREHILKWSIKVCRNIWIDETRKRKVRVALDIDNLSKDLVGDDGEGLALNRINLAEVNTAMELLPEQQRSALSMVSLGGLSYAEIAEILDVPLGTVMSRIARARKNLAKHFDSTKINSTSPNISTNGGGRKHELH